MKEQEKGWAAFEGAIMNEQGKNLAAFEGGQP